MKRPRGVRSRLLLVVVASVAAALAVMTIGFNVLLARSLSRDADAVLHTRAMTEAASVDVTGDKVATPDPPDNGGLESQAWVFRDGQALEEPRVSAALDSAALSAAAAPGATLEVPGQAVRLYAMPASDNPGITVVAGVSLAPYQHTQRLALLASLALAAVLLAVVTVVAHWMLRAALRPVARMTADAETWSEHEPERRFAAGEPYDELSQLAATLDRLLDRLAAGLKREQRFSAEMSHELRTPLAKVSGEAELALRRERPPEEYRQALETILRNTRQMSSAIETLVAAAQQESGFSRGRCTAEAALHEVAETCSGLAAQRLVHVAIEPLSTALEIGLEREVVVRVLQPVVENACGFARSEVRLGARRDGREVLLRVDDDGPGVGVGESETIFEPGVRGGAGEAEAGAHQGAGLGLALARRLARAAGGDVRAVPGAQGGRFEVRLPVG